MRTRLLAALVILCLPYAALGAWVTGTLGIQSLAAFLVSVGALMYCFAITMRTWRGFLLAQLPLLIVGIAYSAYTLSFDSRPGDGLAYVLVTSSWAEVRGFFDIWEGKRLLVAAVMIVAAYATLAILTPPSRITFGNHRYWRAGPLVAMVLLAAYAAGNMAALVAGATTNPVIGTAAFYFGPLQAARAGVTQGYFRKQAFHASRVATREEVHILVIGESARRDSWSVYGYARKTTPTLDSLRDEAVFLGNVVADANLTSYAVPILLTGTPPTRLDLKAVTANLVDLAKEAGYSTTWLMNQDPHISLLAGVQADHMVYPASISSLVEANLPVDGVLLPDLQRELARAGKPRFIGIHSFGSHWDYASRYPTSFNQFSPAAIPQNLNILSGQADPRVLDAYDNSVAYTDWFLGQIIQQARQLDVPASVTYFSDHGEDLLLLDGRAGHGTRAYSKHQYQIPAFVWFNAAYRTAHPEVVQAIAENSAKEIHSHNLMASMAQIMGIEWPGASPSESFASREFIPDTSTAHIAGGILVSTLD